MRARSPAISSTSFSARSAAVACSASGRSRLRTSASTSFARSTWIPTRASFSSARWRRRLNLPSPAASSTSSRRSSGFEASTASTLPWLTIECIEPPSPTSASSSTRSVRRTCALLTRYWPSPPRCSRRAIETSENSRSPKSPLSLSKTSSTSQLSAGVRPSAPLKRTSSGFSARSSDGRQRAGRPDDRVGDVRLAGAVRPDDDGDAGLELQLERVRERLEAAQAERAQVHEWEPSGRRGRGPTAPAARATPPRPCRARRRGSSFRRAQDGTRRRGSTFARSLAPKVGEPFPPPLPSRNASPGARLGETAPPGARLRRLLLPLVVGLCVERPRRTRS